MTRHSLLHITLAVALTWAASSSFASGSDAGGSAETGDAQAYNIGKGVYAQKLGCKSCPLAGKTLDQAAARDLVAGKGTAGLSAEEQKALAVYLSRRFKL